MELVVKVIDLRYNQRSKILERSEKLRGYSILLDYIRQYRLEGCELKDAINLAINRCIGEKILSDFLEKNSPEVGSMLFKEITSEEFAEIRAKEAAEEAAEEYYQKGRMEEREAGIKLLIETYREFSSSKEQALEKLIEKYPMDKEAGCRYLESYWN